MKKLIIGLIWIIISTTSTLCSEVYIYKDNIMVREEIKTNVIALPIEAKNIRITKGKILSNLITNIIDENLLKQYQKLTNEIEVIKLKLEDILKEITKLSNTLILTEKSINNIVKDSQTLSTLVDKYNSTLEKIFTLKQKTLDPLLEEKSRKEKEKLDLENEINQKQTSINFVFLNNKEGVLTYNIPGSWETKYYLDLKKQIMKQKLVIYLPEKIQIDADKLIISTFNYSPELQSVELPKLIGYLSEGVVFKSYIPQPMKSLKSEPESESEEEMHVPKEESTPIGISWEINKRIKLENESEIDISDTPVSITKKYFVIPSKTLNGLMTLSISNLSDLSILPGKLELDLGNQTVENLYIKTLIPQNGVYQTEGIVVDEIIVKREVEEKVENPKFLGTNKRILRTIKNTIKNNLDNIEITILDRIPLPYDDRIKIGINKITPNPTTKIENILKNSTFEITVSIEKGKTVENLVSYWIEYPSEMFYYESER